MADPDLFPVFLKLAGRRVLVVGGGIVATSKIAALQRAGAAITVVAPAVSAAIERAGVEIRRRRFRAADLDGAVVGGLGRDARGQPRRRARGRARGACS